MRRLALLSLILAASALGAENDLSVAWIARLPRIDYVWNSSNPAVEGWPAAGATVTWVANVRWLGGEPLRGVTYRWTIDGAEVRSGTLDFAAGSLVQTELPWTWTFTRHEIAFEIDSEKRITETEKRNNRLLVFSNAIGVGLYVERTYWDGIRPKLKVTGMGATTFDDWMQREVHRLNDMAQYAVYPDTPNGVLDRWRIDDIHLVEDGALPLAPPYAEARDWGAASQDIPIVYPNVLDHTVDVQWGFPGYAVDWWPDTTPAITGWVLTIGSSLLHEWQHARTMIDSYAWNLSPSGDFVKLNPAPSVVASTFYNSTDQGMMHLEWGHFDPYTAAALNQMAGRRALRGNYNEPWDLGWFLEDLPAQNRVRLLRRDGTPIKNRKVTLHRASGASIEDWASSGPYPMTFDNTPGTTLTSDSEGRIEVGRNPFSDGNIFAFVEKANGDVILQIEDGSTRRWAYLESLQFNLAYWRGQTNLADYDVIADAPPCFDQLGPAVHPLPEALVTTRDVRMSFTAQAGLTYELWWAVDGGAPVKFDVPAIPIGGNREEITLSLPEGRIVWWIVEGVSSAPCPARHSSIYVFDHQVVDRKQRAARP